LRIAVVSGEQSAEFVRKQFTKAEVLELGGPDLAAAPRAVADERADVAMSDQFILKRYLRSNADLVDLFDGHPFSVLPIAWAVSKSNADLLKELDPLLSQFMATAAFRALTERYSIIPFAAAPA